MNGRVRMREELSWRTAADYVMLIVGALIQALAMSLFLVPLHLLSSGVNAIGDSVKSKFCKTNVVNVYIYPR